MRNLLVGLLPLAALALAAATPATPPSPQHDLVIRNATIYDGSGQPPAVGDVAVDGDRIVGVGALGNVTGKREIDAHGLAVAPGFINMLSWATDTLLVDG